jgi:hypothetical protein
MALNVDVEKGIPHDANVPESSTNIDIPKAKPTLAQENGSRDGERIIDVDPGSNTVPPAKEPQTDTRHDDPDQVLSKAEKECLRTLERMTVPG